MNSTGTFIRDLRVGHHSGQFGMPHVLVQNSVNLKPQKSALCNRKLQYDFQNTANTMSIDHYSVILWNGA